MRVCPGYFHSLCIVIVLRSRRMDGFVLVDFLVKLCVYTLFHVRRQLIYHGFLAGGFAFLVGISFRVVFVSSFRMTLYPPRLNLYFCSRRQALVVVYDCKAESGFLSDCSAIEEDLLCEFVFFPRKWLLGKREVKMQIERAYIKAGIKTNNRGKKSFLTPTNLPRLLRFRICLIPSLVEFLKSASGMLQFPLHTQNFTASINFL